MYHLEERFRYEFEQLMKEIREVKVCMGKENVT